MLIDNIKIRVSAGKGGTGSVSFSKVKMSLGPTGGNGGNGGDVYLEAVADLGALRQFRSSKEFSAEDGRDGRGAYRDGHNGEDLILKVPRGTVVKNLDTGKQDELVNLGDRLSIAKGGKGGKGNFLYRSSINTTPKKFQYGLPGESFEIELELKLIADIGLVGFPNVGKSSFLNAVTNAKSRVANYQFTTLEPHLGVYYGLILADIPGIIEGASTGKGLGIKFLRHIERTRVIFHLVDATSGNALKDYKAIREELGSYNKELLNRDEYVLISKCDLVDKNRIEEIKEDLSPYNKNILAISIADEKSLKEIKKLLNKLKQDMGIKD